jgi:hypothetical protein
VAISWNVKSSSRMRDSGPSEKQSTNSVHGLLDTQIFMLEQEARFWITSMRSSLKPSYSSSPSIKRQNLAERPHERTSLQTSCSRFKVQISSDAVVIFNRWPTFISTCGLNSGHSLRMSNNSDHRSPSHDFCKGVPALQKKCFPKTSFLFSAQIRRCGIVRGSVQRNFIKVDLPEPTLPRIQKIPFLFSNQ